ncbi:hypothetical protein [Arthrobacter russicus]|uniref:Uncharacterized protein n=1 Tax=Arthrobacter russicus TaxID=172040 RepID=A0ABU1J928_9MICC|nr:hypothetical protein [Arthrobacter russicus]MDR6268928.1 hypothetical protein [Arthrobacter russicus]
MPQTRPNKSTVPVNSDAYNLTGDMATMADSLNVVVPVASAAERDGLTKKPNLLVSRTDLGGVIEAWDTSLNSWSKGRQFAWLRAPEIKWDSTRRGIGVLGTVMDVNNDFCAQSGVSDGFRLLIPGLYYVELFLAGNTQPGSGVATFYRDGDRYTEAGIGSTGSWCGILGAVIYVTGTSDISVDGSSATDWFMVPNFRITRLG